MSLSLGDLLKRLMEMSGSALHIPTNSPPQIRVHGHLVPLDLPQMTPADTKQLAYSVMTDAQKHRFEESLELDFSFGLKGLARFRANVFNQRGATSAVFRLIPFEIKSFNQLGLPAVERLNFEWKDRKSTRLNSSHGYISYAVFCLKKKKK